MTKRYSEKEKSEMSETRRRLIESLEKVCKACGAIYMPYARDYGVREWFCDNTQKTMCKKCAFEQAEC